MTSFGGVVNVSVDGDEQLPGIQGLLRFGGRHRRAEALDFDLPADGRGARRVHPDLAEAVGSARSEGRALETLRADPALRKFLTREAAAEFDPTTLLIGLAGEVALIRAVVGALVEGTRLGTPSYWKPPDWAQLNLPHPLGEL